VDNCMTTGPPVAGGLFTYTAKITRVRKFHGTKVLGLFTSLGAKVPQNESSTGAKVLSVDFLLPGSKVQGNEKSRYHRKCTLPHI